MNRRKYIGERIKGGVIEGKLIIIDGIAGSGKSVTGQKLYRALHLHGYQVNLYHEFCLPHPVLDVKSETIQGWIDQSLSKWRGFIHYLADEETVVILDGAILQCGIGELLERDAAAETINDYVKTVAHLIQPVKPILIHLYQNDVEAALKRIRAHRPDTWTERVHTFLSEANYGRNRSLSGFDLHLDFNRSLRRISDDIFAALEIGRIAIDNSDSRWDAHFDKIRGFLGLSRHSDPFLPGDYCGEYQAAENQRSCRIAVTDGNLRVEGLFKMARDLLPKLDDTVFVQSWPDELTFRRNSRGIVESFCSTGPWDRMGKGTWIRRTTE